MSCCIMCAMVNKKNLSNYVYGYVYDYSNSWLPKEKSVLTKSKKQTNK